MSKKKFDYKEELGIRGYEYDFDWCTWFKPVLNTETGEKENKYIPGFGAVCITDRDIEKI